MRLAVRYKVTVLTFLLLLFYFQSATADPVALEGAGDRSTTQNQWSVVNREGRIHFRFDEAMLDRDMVVWTRVHGAMRDLGHALVRWRREETDVALVMLPDPTAVGETGTQHDEVVVAKFNMIDDCSEESVCFDVTDLFLGEYMNAWDLSGHGLLRNDALFEMPGTYPTNLVVTAVSSSESDKPVRIKWNFVLLPREPMPARRNDRKVGFVYPGVFSLPANSPLSANRPILRWRLKKTDHTKSISTPENPIVIYIDPNTPERWRPWVRSGIESWQAAFEEAGFEQAIIAKEPSDREGWDYDDARNSTLCWGTYPDPCGWQIFDPRTGEILQFQMHSTSESLKLFLAKYLVAMAAVDERVVRTRLSDDVPGQLIRKTAAHETGHILGLNDGSYGTYTYSLAQIKSPEFVASSGFTPSIMNYSRFNYTVQLADRMPTKHLVSEIGPADKYSIRWGYTPLGIDGVDEEEKLREWIAEQDQNPSFRYRRNFELFLTPDAIYDAVEVIEPIEAAAIGINNLKTSVAMLGKHYFDSADREISDLIGPEKLFDAAVEQWVHIVRPAISLIGGYVAREGMTPNMRTKALDRERVHPVPPEEQREAMKFLCETLLAAPPTFLTDSDLARRAGVSRDEATERVLRHDQTTLNEFLFNPMRLNRLIDEKRPGHWDPEVFGITDFITELGSCAKT